MEEYLKIVLGIAVLIVAFPLGNWLKSQTKDEQKIGRKWFRLIIWICLPLILLGLITNKDWILFTCSFIAIVTTRSLK